MIIHHIASQQNMPTNSQVNISAQEGKQYGII